VDIATEPKDVVVGDARPSKIQKYKNSRRTGGRRDARAASDDGATKPANQEADDKQDEKDDEQDLGNSGRRDVDSGEPQKAGDQCNDQEDYSPP
jgi:hypothetical protein